MQDIETNLSKQVLSEQIKHGWPGQVHLAKNLCEALNITGLLDPEVSRSQFKSEVKRACHMSNDQDLTNQIQSYKKMSAIRDEISKGNSYFLEIRTALRLNR